MEEQRKVVLLAFGIFCLIGLLVGVYFLFFAGGPKTVPPQKAAEAVKPPAAASDKEGIPTFPPTSLDSSDDLIRKLAKELSANARLDSWLQSKDLIRKFTAAVDNIASGESPAKHIDFFGRVEAFRVYRVGPAEYLDPSSYDRYNAAAEVFVSFNPQEAVRFYKGLRPLFHEAYKDLGYSGKDFDLTLQKAVLELLETPVVEGDIRLEKKVKTYAFADPKLEGLSDAQKHFLRMGPANVEAVQIKLREMAAALGIPADQVPRPRIYSVR